MQIERISDMGRGISQPFDSMNLIGEGLKNITEVFSSYQKQKTARKAIEGITDVTVESIRANMMTSLARIRTDCENRGNSLEALMTLMAGKTAYTSEELDMVLTFLLKVGLSQLDLNPQPNIDQALRLISPGFSTDAREEDCDDRF